MGERWRPLSSGRRETERRASERASEPDALGTNPGFLGPTLPPAHSPTEDGPYGPAPYLQLCSLGHLCLQVEDLFLTFAKKASAFNSWFENAEEDLTDPVRCNSLEEIKALREAHDAFRSSLSSAQADFNQLAELDRQIKSFRVASNPYTWFTMEALEETWRNLQKIIKVLPHRRARPWQGSPSSMRSEQSGMEGDFLYHKSPCVGPLAPPQVCGAAECLPDAFCAVFGLRLIARPPWPPKGVDLVSTFRKLTSCLYRMLRQAGSCGARACL